MTVELVEAQRLLEWATRYARSHPQQAVAATQAAFGWMALHDRVVEAGR